MRLYPAGALVLIIGMFCLLAVPPSGLFISEYMIFKALIFGNYWFVTVITLILLCVVVYAMSVRIMHICFSEPREIIHNKYPEKIHPAETITQFVFLMLVIALCFYRPPFLDELIRQGISIIANH